MPYPDDPFNLSDKTNNELHAWTAKYEPGTDEYVAGIKESMRRVASIEEDIEKSEEPVRRRELTAMAVAVITLATIIIAVVFFS